MNKKIGFILLWSLAIFSILIYGREYRSIDGVHNFRGSDGNITMSIDANGDIDANSISVDNISAIFPTGFIMFTTAASCPSGWTDKTSTFSDSYIKVGTVDVTPNANNLAMPAHGHAPGNNWTLASGDVSGTSGGQSGMSAMAPQTHSHGSGDQSEGGGGYIARAYMSSATAMRLKARAGNSNFTSSDYKTFSGTGGGSWSASNGLVINGTSSNNTSGATEAHTHSDGTYAVGTAITEGTVGPNTNGDSSTSITGDPKHIVLRACEKD